MMQASIRLLMKEGFGWRKSSKNGITFWYQGYLLNGDFDSLFEGIVEIDKSVENTIVWLKESVSQLTGHFAIVVEGYSWIFAAVDRVRSIPIAFFRDDLDLVVSNHAPSIQRELNLVSSDMDIAAAVEIAMSGYTFGNRTLFEKLWQLEAGEYLALTENGWVHEPYYSYAPWVTTERSEDQLVDELTDVMLTSLEEMVGSIGDRQIIVPLSAGNDSRYVVSGLKHLGVKNVQCITYGKQKSFESKTAKAVADQLGYKWSMYPCSIKSQRKIFASEDFADYLDYADTLSNVPIVFEYGAIRSLRKDGESVVINGSTGDFISGGHINYYLNHDQASEVEGMLANYLRKHLQLWECLSGLECGRQIVASVMDQLYQGLLNTEVGTESFWAILESNEWRHRQSKLITSFQRNYEFQGMEWRLPLWDHRLMDFWSTVPLQYKVGSGLYRKVLRKNNWGGVWYDIKVNDSNIASMPLRLSRLLVKALVAPGGKARWHRLERKLFGYFLDITSTTSIVDYRDAIFDTCGARGRLSWVAQKYLQDHRVINSNLRELDEKYRVYRSARGR